MPIILEIIIISTGSLLISLLGILIGAAFVGFDFYAVPNNIPVIIIMEIIAYLSGPLCLWIYSKFTGRDFNIISGMIPAVLGVFLGGSLILGLLALGYFNIYIFAAAYLILGTVNVLFFRRK